MFIDIHELELHPMHFDVKFRPGTIDLGTEARQAEPLATTGRAELVSEHHGRKGRDIEDIHLVGKLSTRLELQCARCLEPVPSLVEREYDLLFRPQGIDAGQEELSISGPEAEIGYYTGDGLTLEDVLREQVLLALPMRVVCREDCQGLCPQCGANLNQGRCSCSRPPDARWEALKGLKEKLE